MHSNLPMYGYILEAREAGICLVMCFWSPSTGKLTLVLLGGSALTQVIKALRNVVGKI